MTKVGSVIYSKNRITVKYISKENLEARLVPSFGTIPGTDIGAVTLDIKRFKHGAFLHESRNGKEYVYLFIIREERNAK